MAILLGFYYKYKDEQIMLYMGQNMESGMLQIHFYYYNVFPSLL